MGWQILYVDCEFVHFPITTQNLTLFKAKIDFINAISGISFRKVLIASSLTILFPSKLNSLHSEFDHWSMAYQF